GHHRALGAVAGNDGRVAALAALDGGSEAVDAIFALGLFATVAFHAGLLEDRFDVLLVSQALFVRSGREFGGVPLHFFLFFFRRRKGQGGQTEGGGEEDSAGKSAGRRIRVHASIIHGWHFNQRRPRRQNDLSLSGGVRGRSRLFVN